MADSKNNTDNGPKLLGQLLEEEKQSLTMLKQQSEQAVYQVGRAAVGMLRQYKTIDQLEAQAQAVLNGAGARLNIPQGTPWSVDGDGNVLQMSQPQPAPEPAPEPAPAPEPTPEPEPDGDEG